MNDWSIDDDATNSRPFESYRISLASGRKSGKRQRQQHKKNRLIATENDRDNYSCVRQWWQWQTATLKMGAASIALPSRCQRNRHHSFTCSNRDNGKMANMEKPTATIMHYIRLKFHFSLFALLRNARRTMRKSVRNVCLFVIHKPIIRELI